MNVSYWFGRGLLLDPDRLNAPPAGREDSVWDFFGEYELQNLPFSESGMRELSPLPRPFH